MYSPNSPSRVDSTDLLPNWGAIASSEAVLSLYDLYTPAAMTNYFVRHGSRPSYKMKLKALGFSRGFSTPTVAHYEKSWRTNLTRFSAVVTPSAGVNTPVVLTIDPTTTRVDGAGRRLHPLIKGQILEAPISRVQAIVDNIVPSGGNINVTLRPLSITTDLATHFVINTDYASPTRQDTEGSGLPASRIGFFYRYSNTSQIIKSAQLASGTEHTNEAYFSVEHISVPDGNGSFKRGALCVDFDKDMLDDYERNVSGALLFGKQTTATIANSDTGLGYATNVKTTEGLIEWVSNHGYTDTYTPTTYALQDFNNLAVLMEQEWTTTREFTMWTGQLLHNEIEDMLKAAFNTVHSSDIYFDLGYKGRVGDGDTMPLERADDYGVRVGFQRLGKAGFDWNLATMHEFNHGQGFGSAGYNYNQMAVILPTGKLRNTQSDGSGNLPFIGYRYKEMGSYKRENIVGYFGGAGSEGINGVRYASNQYDVAQSYIITEIAAHHACPNTTVIQRPA